MSGVRFTTTTLAKSVYACTTHHTVHAYVIIYLSLSFTLSDKARGAITRRPENCSGTKDSAIAIRSAVCLSFRFPCTRLLWLLLNTNKCTDQAPPERNFRCALMCFCVVVLWCGQRAGRETHRVPNGLPLNRRTLERDTAYWWRTRPCLQLLLPLRLLIDYSHSPKTHHNAPGFASATVYK